MLVPRYLASSIVRFLRVIISCRRAFDQVGDLARSRQCSLFPRTSGCDRWREPQLRLETQITAVAPRPIVTTAPRAIPDLGGLARIVDQSELRHRAASLSQYLWT